MIALLGATGYTGRLVAAELAHRGVPHRLGGRSAERLATLPPGPGRETFVVDVAEPHRLDRFLGDAEVLITTVGPFARLGWPAVEAAVRNGVAYIDCAGEPAFLRAVYDRFGGAAAPVVPGCGVEYVPGDLSAAVAAADLGGAVQEVAVTYHFRGAVPSRGTLGTALELSPGDLRPRRRRRVAFPEGVREAVEIVLGERVTVARHLPGAKVVTAAAVPATAASLAERALPSLSRCVPSVLPEGPPAWLRHRGRLRVLVEALGPAGRRAVIAECRDLYGLTARILVEAAARLRGAGPMAPAQALDPAGFLSAISGETERGAFAWRRLDTP